MVKKSCFQVNIETLTAEKIEKFSSDMLILASNASTITKKEIQTISEFVELVADGVKQEKTTVSFCKRKNITVAFKLKAKYILNQSYKFFSFYDFPIMLCLCR